MYRFVDIKNATLLVKIRYKKYIEIFDKTKKTCNNENIKKVSTLVNDNHKVSEFLFFMEVSHARYW